MKTETYVKELVRGEGNHDWVSTFVTGRRYLSNVGILGHKCVPASKKLTV